MEKIVQPILKFFTTPYGLFLVGILFVMLWLTTSMKQEGFASSATASPGSYSFVMYYAPWCPHCKNAHTPWSSFKQMLKNRNYTYGGKRIVFEDINAESDKGKAALYKITAYPTFKVETNNKIYEMVGAPSVKTFTAFLTKALGPEKIF